MSASFEERCFEQQGSIYTQLNENMPFEAMLAVLLNGIKYEYAE